MCDVLLGKSIWLLAQFFFRFISCHPAPYCLVPFLSLSLAHGLVFSGKRCNVRGLGQNQNSHQSQMVNKSRAWCQTLTGQISTFNSDGASILCALESSGISSVPLAGKDAVAANCFGAHLKFSSGHFWSIMEKFWTKYLGFQVDRVAFLAQEFLNQRILSRHRCPNPLLVPKEHTGHRSSSCTGFPVSEQVTKRKEREQKQLRNLFF